MKIAVEGCAHGELEKIYDVIAYFEKKNDTKVDLLLCCGDFQATRNVHDLNSMAVPPKYREMCTFYKYYSGEKIAPVLTIFIGGNHEASNYLQELPYGGWVAPNIYYLGLAGVVNFRGLRIAGLSGIYKPNDYMMGRYEKPPYNENSKRSIYHIRNLEVFRLKQLKQPIDIFMSHDWPRGIHKYGNTDSVLKYHPHLKEDMDSNKLGSLPGEELLNELKPKFWFSAHLHCKFAALVPHDEQGEVTTKFLALDKSLPRRKFLQILDMESDCLKDMKLEYDIEWLSVLHFTNHLISYKRDTNILPNKEFAKDNIRWNFTPTDIEMDFIRAKMSGEFTIPENFVTTAPAFVPGQSQGQASPPSPNPQTQAFCRRLGVSDMFEEVLGLDGGTRTDTANRQSFGSPATPTFNSFVESDPGISSSGSEEEQTEDNPSSPNSDEMCTPVRNILSLPPPKNSGDLDVASPAEESPQKRSPSPSLTPTPPTSESITAEVDKEAGFLIDTTPISHKKFKRRNIDIYKPSEDEES